MPIIARIRIQDCRVLTSSVARDPVATDAVFSIQTASFGDRPGGAFDTFKRNQVREIFVEQGFGQFRFIGGPEHAIDDPSGVRQSLIHRDTFLDLIFHRVDEIGLELCGVFGWILAASNNQKNGKRGDVEGSHWVSTLI